MMMMMMMFGGNFENAYFVVYVLNCLICIERLRGLKVLDVIYSKADKMMLTP